MKKVYLKEPPKSDKRRVYRLFGFITLMLGLFITSYVFLPLIFWFIFFYPSFSQQNIQSPVPEDSVVSESTVGSLIANAKNSFADYNNASNWYPNYKFEKNANSNKYYSISIPKLKIKNAIVSASDTDLSKHLVNYTGTSLPPQRGNAVVFGHSTLPHLYNEKDYKTIFTYLYKLTPGDEIIVNSQNSIYKYRVEKVIVVDADNTKILSQNRNGSFLTLVTCTPPGTIWKRLAVTARIEI